MALPSEEDRARVRGYLLAQAEKYDLLDLWPRVMGQRTAYLSAIEGVSQEQALWRPPAGAGVGDEDEEAWGILEVTQHVATWSENVLALMQALSAGDGLPKMPAPGYIERDLSESIDSARRRLVEVSSRLSAFIASPGADGELERTAEHALFGPLNVRGWVLFQRIHDVDHVNQVNALKSAEGFPGATR